MKRNKLTSFVFTQEDYLHVLELLNLQLDKLSVRVLATIVFFLKPECFLVFDACGPGLLFAFLAL
jgi:hypothetical protein